MRTLALFPLALALVACGDRCEDISRIDGAYAVLHEAEPSAATGSGVAAYPWDDVFVGGWSEWDLRYVPGNQTFDLDLDGQAFRAAYVADTQDCEAFTLSFEGTYVGEGGSLHDFAWVGALEVAGSHLQGTASWSDVWEDPGAASSGDIELASMTITANLREE